MKKGPNLNFRAEILLPAHSWKILLFFYQIETKYIEKKCQDSKTKHFPWLFEDETNIKTPHYILPPLHFSNFSDLRETLTALCSYSLILRRKEMPMSPDWSAIQVYTANVYRQTTYLQTIKKCSSPEFIPELLA